MLSVSSFPFSFLVFFPLFSSYISKTTPLSTSTLACLPSRISFRYYPFPYSDFLCNLSTFLVLSLFFPRLLYSFPFFVMFYFSNLCLTSYVPFYCFIFIPVILFSIFSFPPNFSVSYISFSPSLYSSVTFLAPSSLSAFFFLFFFASPSPYFSVMFAPVLPFPLLCNVFLCCPALCPTSGL
jgi:hypothetical protein